MAAVERREGIADGGGVDVPAVDDAHRRGGSAVHVPGEKLRVDVVERAREGVGDAIFKDILGIGIFRGRARGVEGVQEGRDERLGAVLRGSLAAVPVEQAERVEADAAPLGARRGEGLVLSLHDFPRVRDAARRVAGGILRVRGVDVNLAAHRARLPRIVVSRDPAMARGRWEPFHGHRAVSPPSRSLFPGADTARAKSDRWRLPPTDERAGLIGAGTPR